MTIVILYRNKWIFDKIRVIMMLLSEMRVTMALEYRKIVNKNEFSERGWSNRAEGFTGYADRLFDRG